MNDKRGLSLTGGIRRKTDTVFCRNRFRRTGASDSVKLGFKNPTLSSHVAVEMLLNSPELVSSSTKWA